MSVFKYKFRLVAIVIAVVLASSLIITSFTKSSKAFDNSNIQQLLISEIEDKFTKIGDYSQAGLLESKEPEVVMTKFDPLNPKYSLITNDGIYSSPPKSKADSTSFEIIVFTLTRANIFDENFKILDYKLVDIKNYSYQKVLDLAARYDLSSNEYSDKNITKMDSFTDQEILNQINLKTKKSDPVLHANENYLNEQEKTDVTKYESNKMSVTEQINFLTKVRNTYLDYQQQFQSGSLKPDEKVCRFGYCLSNEEIDQEIDNQAKLIESL